jgi:hypothetical protein
MAQQRPSHLIGLLPPFLEDCAINKDSLNPHTSSQNYKTPVPVGHGVNMPTMISHIPGKPTLFPDPKIVEEFLERELATPLLDQLSKNLWFFARASGQHIDAIHCQRIMGREIVPVEDPKLHLIWRPDTIYLKPIPECLLNYEFWLVALAKCDPKNLRPQAIGFLRSYAFLIQHRIDFDLAKNLYLIPKDVTWDSWAIFISHFRDLEDWKVSKRYRYGQIRLSRLHWLVRLTQPDAAEFSMFYVLPYTSIGSFVSGIQGPLTFLFGSTTVLLASMQLLTASDYASLAASEFELAKRVAWKLAIAVMVFLPFMSLAAFFIIPMFELLRQLRYTLFKNRKTA